MLFNKRIANNFKDLSLKLGNGDLTYDWEFSHQCSAAYFLESIIEDEEEEELLSMCCVGLWSSEYEDWQEGKIHSNTYFRLNRLMQKYRITLEDVVFFEFCGVWRAEDYKENYDRMRKDESGEGVDIIFKEDTYGNVKFAAAFFNTVGDKILQYLKDNNTAYVDSTLII